MTRTISSWIVIVGGALVTLGSLLPWVTATSFIGLTISRSAWQLGSDLRDDGTGPLILIAGLIVAGLGLALLNATPPHPGPTLTAAMLLSVIIGLFVWYKYSSLSSFTNSAGSGIVISIAYGYWLCAIGAALATFGTISRNHARVDDAPRIAPSNDTSNAAEPEDLDNEELGYICSPMRQHVGEVLRGVALR